MNFAKNPKLSSENSSDYEEEQPKTQVRKISLNERSEFPWSAALGAALIFKNL
jgi:hypothetical protein